MRFIRFDCGHAAGATSRIREISCRRLAPIRLEPFSYFCTCWNDTSSAAPSFCWLMPSTIRRMRTRLPTCRSMGLGSFFSGGFFWRASCAISSFGKALVRMALSDMSKPPFRTLATGQRHSRMHMTHVIRENFRPCNTFDKTRRDALTFAPSPDRNAGNKKYDKKNHKRIITDF